MTESFPQIQSARLPAVTRTQMIEVDRLMIDVYGIHLLQMMENAGLNLARLVRSYLGGPLSGKQVLVLAGSGNNAGGGITAARRLATWGANVRIITSRPPASYAGVPATQLEATTQMGIPVVEFAGDLPASDALIDAVIGYSLDGAPRGVAVDMIERANQAETNVISLDVPSGVDVDTGEAPGEAIRATATLTLALPKVGLVKPHAAGLVGDLFVADISVPPSLYRHLGLSTEAIFEDGTILRVLP